MKARIVLPATLMAHLGLRELVQEHLDLGAATGAARAGDKVCTLVASALAGGDCCLQASVSAARY